MNYYVKRFLSVWIFLVSLPALASSLEYAVIVDAGSSGSRAHVFEYARALPMIPIPVINDFFNQNTKPGLSSFAPTGAGAGASLKPILDASVTALKGKGIDPAQVPLKILATAGMRLLPPDQQEAIYENVRAYVHANYTFQLKDRNVRTITGVMEGVYDWLDVNYLKNTFINPPKTVGAIDMGGASTQIAFATHDSSKPENEVVLTINHTVYRIFSQSFLGLGLNQAIQTMGSYTDAPNCYPSGYTFGMQTGDFHFPPCSNIYTDIISSFDVSQNVLPTTGVHFVAFSGVYSIFSFFDIIQTPSQTALQSQIDAVCYLPWTTLLSNYPSVPPAFLSTNCANGVYLDDLLYNTYQLQESQLTVATEIDGKGIDWTLGALLYSLVA